MPSVTFKDIALLKSNLAPSQLEKLAFPNHNFKLVKSFLSRRLDTNDNGQEVGSVNYISTSPKFFFKAKALTSASYLPNFTNGLEYIRPQVFRDYSLKEGDVLISKDSNIGEVIILDKDYPDAMPSGAIYRLPIATNKYYLLAFMKNSIVKDQLDVMVPKGATIRHAKTLFLDCKIPIPNQKNAGEVITYVETLMKLIIEKESAIQIKKQLMNQLIDVELNTGSGNFYSISTKFTDLLKEKRLDTGLYGKKYREISNKIAAYSGGQKTLKELGYSVARGQNLQISNIGQSIYSDTHQPNFYKLILSKDFTEWMTFRRNSYIGNPHKLRTISKGDIIFSCRGDLGRVIVFCEDNDGYVTNIDNVHLHNPSANMVDNIFVGSFLLYLRESGFLSRVAITGSGADSFTKYHFDYINIPIFSEKVKKAIAQLFYNPKPIATGHHDIIKQHDKWNEEVGIYDLDKSIKMLKMRLDNVLTDIANDVHVEIDHK